LRDSGPPEPEGFVMKSAVVPGRSEHADRIATRVPSGEDGMKGLRELTFASTPPSGRERVWKQVCRTLHGVVCQLADAQLLFGREIFFLSHHPVNNSSRQQFCVFWKEGILHPGQH